MDIYDTNTLLEVINVQKPPTTYWLDLCFPQELQFDTQDILFDTVEEFRTLAPFVSPNVQGRVMRERGFSTKLFRPAYVKPKHIVNPSRAIPRRPGEAITGSLSPQQRMDAIIADNMRMQKDAITRRWEWMAAKAIIDSAVTVAGDDYPSVTVEFGRHVDLDNQLLSAARWSQTTATPLADIELMRKRAFQKARAPINRLTFGLDAWEHFVSFDEVQALLKTDLRGSDSIFNRAPSAGEPFEFRGFLAGQGGIGRLEMWTYSDQFDDDADAAQDFLTPSHVIGTGPSINGKRCFGAIMDSAAQLRPLPMFPKMWSQEDPAAVYTMTQSAPLMVPAQPNASFRIKTV